MLPLTFSNSQLDESLHQKIREPMATIRSAVHAISTLAVTAEQDLESELLSGADSFQALLEQAATRLRTANGNSSHELREVRLIHFTWLSTKALTNLLIVIVRSAF